MATQHPLACADGRETRLIDFVFAKDRTHDIENDPLKVLEAIDEFAQRESLMNVGFQKGQVIEKRLLSYIAEHRYSPMVMVELGAYVGYSAIMFARFLPSGSKYFSLEEKPAFAAISTKLIELAGLQNVVKVVVGPASETILKLVSKYRVKKVDAVFLDHAKDRYTPDLRLLEEQGLICKGTLVFADNMLIPGNPAYMAYVRGEVAEPSPIRKYRSELVKSKMPYDDNEDGVDISECLE